jgi:prepilin-type N-terminal cleavage/methylation domain-containing protein
MTKQRGFTIIELIVVIAIIAILAAIVLVNVVQYINKAHDAAVQGNMGVIQTNAGAFYSDNTRGNGAYTGFDGAKNTNLTVEYTNPEAAIVANDYNKSAVVKSFGITADCAASACATNWCMSAPLSSSSGSTSWCMDATGVAAAGNEVCTLATNLCTAP